MNFLSGTAAATGVTFVTAIPAGVERGLAAWNLAICGLPWLGLSIVLAYEATLVENARREVDKAATPALSALEIKDIERSEAAKIRKPVGVSDVLAILALLMGLLIPVWMYTGAEGVQATGQECAGGGTVEATGPAGNDAAR